jgi:hypothetical protein
MNAPRHQDQGPGGMFADMLAHVMRLVQGEIALFRAEARQRAQAAQTAVIRVLLAVVVGITALNVLSGAAVAAIVAMGLAPHWATLVVGGVLALVAVLLSRAALSAVQSATSGPIRSAASVKRDVETLQAMVKQDATA